MNTGAVSPKILRFAQDDKAVNLIIWNGYRTIDVRSTLRVPFSAP